MNTTKTEDLIEIFPGTLWARPSEIRAVEAKRGFRVGNIEVQPYVSVAFDNGGDKDGRQLTWPSYSTTNYETAQTMARDIASRISRSPVEKED